MVVLLCEMGTVVRAIFILLSFVFYIKMLLIIAHKLWLWIHSQSYFASFSSQYPPMLSCICHCYNWLLPFWQMSLLFIYLFICRFWSMWKGCVGFAAITTKVSAHGCGVYLCLLYRIKDKRALLAWPLHLMMPVHYDSDMIVKIQLKN